MVRGDLQQLGGVGKTVYFVEDDAAVVQSLEKGLGILHRPSHARKFAVEVLDLREGSGQGGFAGPPDSPQPEDRAVSPLLLDATDPVVTSDHTPAG